LGALRGDFISQEDVAPLIDAIRRAVQNPEERQVLRLHGRRRDGSIIDVEAVGRRLRDMSEPPCAVFNWRDISERVRVEQELERARDASKEAFDEINRLRQLLESENAYLRQEILDVSGNSELLGSSAGLRRVREQI
jgi:PAS domain-containing protein